MTLCCTCGQPAPIAHHVTVGSRTRLACSTMCAAIVQALALANPSRQESNR